MCREGLYFCAFLSLVGAFLLSPFALINLSPPSASGALFQVVFGLTLIFFPFLMLDFRERKDCYLFGKKLRETAFEGVVLFSLLGLLEALIPNSRSFLVITGLGVSLSGYFFGKRLEAKSLRRRKDGAL